MNAALPAGKPRFTRDRLVRTLLAEGMTEARLFDDAPKTGRKRQPSTHWQWSWLCIQERQTERGADRHRRRAAPAARAAAQRKGMSPVQHQRCWIGQGERECWRDNPAYAAALRRFLAERRFTTGGSGDQLAIVRAHRRAFALSRMPGKCLRSSIAAANSPPSS